MSRRFWGTMMFVAVLLTAGSGYLIFDRLGEPQPQPVALRNVPPDEVPPMPVAAETAAPAGGAVASTGTAVSPSTGIVSAAVDSAATGESPAPTGDEKRNILFRLVRPTAKEVLILGDFTKWMRRPMRKKGRFWEFTFPLPPGNYEYAFIVDGRRVRDPNNKQAGSNGKSSILTVKPLGKRP